MNSVPEFIISSAGLNEYECCLLARQLKILQGRTNGKWFYRDEPSLADVTIVLSDDRLSAAAYIGKTISSCPMRLEFPFRLLGLLNILEESEIRLADTAAKRLSQVDSLAVRLSTQTLPVMFIHNNFTAHLVPADGYIYSNIPFIEHLVSVLALTPCSAEFFPIDDRSTPIYSHSLRAVVWALALLEPARPERFSTNMEYRISEWPLFGEWKSSPELMRLAALFTQNFATLEDGASFALIKHDDVTSFLHACSCCKLGLETRASNSVATTEYPSPQAAGLLQRLRKRLGIGFKRP